MKEPIQLQQLRIGNILSYDDKPCYVSTLSLDPDDESEDTIGVLLFNKSGEILGWNREERIYNHLNFMPITEGWLLDLQYEKRNIVWHDKSESHGLYVKDRYFVEFTTEGIVFAEIYSDGGFKKGHFYRILEYVHQLQNLHSSLTGKELRINKLSLTGETKTN